MNPSHKNNKFKSKSKYSLNKLNSLYAGSLQRRDGQFVQNLDKISP